VVLTYLYFLLLDIFVLLLMVVNRLVEFSQKRKILQFHRRLHLSQPSSAELYDGPYHAMLRSPRIPWAHMTALSLIFLLRTFPQFLCGDTPMNYMPRGQRSTPPPPDDLTLPPHPPPANMNDTFPSAANTTLHIYLPWEAAPRCSSLLHQGETERTVVLQGQPSVLLQEASAA
jgi:hypothetical protein